MDLVANSILAVDISAVTAVAVVLGGMAGAAVARFLDKSNWRDVAESRGAEIDDLKDAQEALEGRVAYLEAQIEGLIALKSEQIAHLVLEGMETHRGDS